LRFGLRSRRLPVHEFHRVATFGIRSSKLLTDEAVIFSMGPNPEPEHPIRCLNSDGSVMHANTRGPEPTNLFEVERRIPWVRFQKDECFVGEFLH
jgi:hypothetical protein